MNKSPLFNLSDLVVSRAEESDCNEIFFLQKRAFVQEAEVNGGNYSITPIKQTLSEYQLEFSNFVNLKAVVNTRIISAVRAIQKGDTCYIGRLITEPVFQNFGIGITMMNAIETYFTNVKRFELFTGEKSTGNVRFYLNRGYTIFNKTEDIPGVTLLMFEKIRQG